MNQESLLSIGEASKLIGVSEKTLRDWDKSGKLKSFKTAGGHRRYDIESIRKMQGCQPGVHDDYLNSGLCQSDIRKVQNRLDRQNQFWIENGLVSGDSIDDKNLCNLLSNYMDWSIVASDEFHDDDPDTETMLKLTKSIWDHILGKQYISVQTISAPCGLMFYIDTEFGAKGEIVTKRIQSEPSSAKTFMYQSIKNHAALPVKNHYDQYASVIASEIDSHIISTIVESSPVEFPGVNEEFKVSPNDEFIIIATHDIGILERFGKLTIHEDYKDKKYLEPIGTLWVENEQKELTILCGNQKTCTVLDPDDFTPQMKFVIGRKPESLMDSQIFFHPYILVLNGPTFAGTNETYFMGRSGFYCTKNYHFRVIDMTAIINKEKNLS